MAPYGGDPMITREAISFDLLRIQYSRAARSVACPRCNAHPGQECESTGGGNRARVATHRARWDRITHWTEEQLSAAHELVRSQGSTWWPHLPDGFYAGTEAAATPIVAKVKQPTPKGVRLTEAQAEEIESAAANGGVCWVSTAHFHGDAQHRQTTNALEAKGIYRATGEVSDGGWERRLELTEFGWSVYHQHRLVIRRVPDEQHPPICPCRPNTPTEQVGAIQAKPEIQAAQGRLAQRWENTRKELIAAAPLRDVTAEARNTTGLASVTNIADYRRKPPTGGVA